MQSVWIFESGHDSIALTCVWYKNLSFPFKKLVTIVLENLKKKKKKRVQERKR